MKRLLALAAILIPVYLFAQGFGSFTHDQPYLAKDLVSGSVNPLPTGALFLWVNPVQSNVFKSQFVTNPVTAANGDPIGAVVDSSTNAYRFTNNVIDAGQNIIRWYTNRHGNTNPVIFVNASVGNAILHCNDVIVTNSVLDFWTFTAYYADTSTGYNFFPNFPYTSYTTGGGTICIVRLLTGSGSTFVQGQTGSTLFTYKNNDWELLSIYCHQESGNNIVVIRTNGVLSVASTNTTSGIQIRAGLTLGGVSDGSSSSGDIAEMIGFGRTMTSNEVYTVENYLRRHPVQYFGP